MLKFDNQVIKKLPLDTSREPGVRQVRNACYSLVDPTPLDNPQLVAHSQIALDLLSITPNMVRLLAKYLHTFHGVLYAI